MTDAGHGAPDHGPRRSIATPVLVLILGLVQAGIIYALIAVDSPVSAFARRAAATWPGRLLLATIGMLVITVGMITLLTFLERRRPHDRQSDADR